jgi:hypothetical protein
MTGCSPSARERATFHPDSVQRALFPEGSFDVNASSLRRTTLWRRKFFDLGKKSLPFANEWAIIANRRGELQ